MPRLPPPLLALAAAGAQRALARRSPEPARGRLVAAGVVTAASGWLASSASRGFGRVGTTVQPFRPEEASVLVTTGANALSRNPMYLGMTGLLVAHAVRRGSWLALVPVAVFATYLDRVQVRAEEAALLDRFGPEYEAYCRDTPRWLDLRSLQAVTARGR